MKTLLNNKKTLTIALIMIFSLHSRISQKPLFGLVAQTSDVFLNSEWSLAESNVNGVSVSLENSGLPIFRSPHNENFFLHYYGVSCLGSFKVTYTDVTEDSFNLDTIIEYDSCNYTDPEELAAIELYQSFYFELPLETNGTPKNPFTYEWIDSEYPVDDLRITNPDGDWLLYRTAFLSTPAFHQDSFTLYPNPVKETLNINNHSNQQVTAFIYDFNGKLLQSHSIENHTTALDVKSLNQGLYFIIFETQIGERVSKKFVKK